ncbi:hypothetical protein, partial [Streptococcus pneumoniae]|uniref:hypothetical protein n=1 Tax=Streptococcus pneumoniae TaxID=1313 RepID=UPI0018B05944
PAAGQEDGIDEGVATTTQGLEDSQAAASSSARRIMIAFFQRIVLVLAVLVLPLRGAETIAAYRSGGEIIIKLERFDLLREAHR